MTPPQPTDSEVAYLQKTTALRSRATALQRRLAGVRQQTERGQLDSIDLESERLQLAATDAYSRALPVVVE